MITVWSLAVANFQKVTETADFLQVLLSKVLYEDCMTFLPECGADISDSNIPTHLWIHNDSMYVRFGGIRNTKTWSKSAETVVYFISKYNLIIPYI